MATQKLVFQTNDEVKQNWNWGCSLPCPDAGYKYHRPGATKAVDAKAGFSCGFQWSGGVGVRSIFGFGYDREASGFVGCLGLFLAVLSLCCCTRAFPSYGRWQLLFVVVTSLVAGHGL